MDDPRGRWLERRISRRMALRAALVGGAGLAGALIIGCEDGEEATTASPTSRATGTPGAPTPTPSPAGAAPSTWRLVTPEGMDVPPARRDHNLTWDGGGRLLLFGGRQEGEALNDLWAFDLGEREWVQISTSGGPAAPRFGHGAVFDEQARRLVVFGGQGAAFFNDVWAFEEASNVWKDVTPAGAAPAKRYGMSAALDAASGRMFISHGFTDQGRFDDTWALPLAADAWSDVSPAGTRPIERCLHRLVWDASNQRLLLFGGQTNSDPFLGDLWAFQPGTGWRSIATEPMPSERNLYAAVYDETGRRLVLFGGQTPGGPANDLWLLDVTNDTWRQANVAGEAPSVRSSHDAVFIPERRSLMVFGGRAESDLNDLWEIDLAQI